MTRNVHTKEALLLRAKDWLGPGINAHAHAVADELANGILAVLEPPTPIDKPIPGKEIRRDVFPEYALIEEEPAGFQTEGFTWLETACIGKCPHKYRITAGSPDYAAIKESLDRGDRSVIFCYHGKR